MKKTRTLLIRNRLDLEALGYQPIMPKNLPGHWRSGVSIHHLRHNEGRLLYVFTDHRSGRPHMCARMGWIQIPYPSHCKVPLITMPCFLGRHHSIRPADGSKIPWETFHRRAFLDQCSLHPEVTFSDPSFFDSWTWAGNIAYALNSST